MKKKTKKNPVQVKDCTEKKKQEYNASAPAEGIESIGTKLMRTMKSP